MPRARTSAHDSVLARRAGHTSSHMQFAGAHLTSRAADALVASGTAHARARAAHAHRVPCPCRR